jgi:mono/diheme cytochrome c family protein
LRSTEENDKYAKWFKKQHKSNSVMINKLIRKSKLRSCVLFIAFAILIFSKPDVYGQSMDDLFRTNCSSCHTIGGGKLIGPDLKDVENRKDREWLIKFMLDPEAMIKSGDQYASKILAEANGVIMTPIPGINVEKAELILDLISSESKLEISQFIGKKYTDEPLEDPDPVQGDMLFTGKISFKNGAPSCISCHTGAGPAVGGSLGPNLITVFQRLQGRNALMAWLSSPPTSTMQSVFEEHPLDNSEIRLLVDLFEAWNGLDRSYNHDSFIIWMSVIFCGFGGTIIGLIIFGNLWLRRFRNVRRSMIKNIREKVKI